MAYSSGTRDFKFDVPDGWVDRSMIAWSAPATPGQALPPNIMVAYDAPHRGESLASYVDRQLKDLSSKAKNFRIELRRDVDLKGRGGVEVVFQWDSGAGPMKQRQVFAFLGDGRAVSFVNTAAPTEFERAEPFFAGMWNSLKWIEPA